MLLPTERAFKVRTVTLPNRPSGLRWSTLLRLPAAAVLACLGASTSLGGCADEPTAAPACDAEPELRYTTQDIEFVRTPDACFDDLPDWDYAPRYVEIDGLRQAYIDEGPEDGEVVLLLHGQPSWSYLYRKMIPVLVDGGYRVIAMDHLGMGRSDKPTDSAYYSYVLHSDRLERFIEALDLRDITIFVQDWGSLIGLRVAGANIDRFARIAIGDGDLPVAPADTVIDFGIENPDQAEDLPFPYANIPPQQTPLYDGCTLLVDEVMAQLGTGGFEEWARYAMKGASFHPAEVLEALTWFDLPDAEEAAYDSPFPSRIYMAGPRTFPSLAQALPGLNADEWAALSMFEGPVVTIWSSNDPGNLGQCDTQNRWICTVPGAAGQPHARLPESSHFLQDDQGAEIARRLVSFMRQDGAVAGNYEADCSGGEGEGEGGLGATCESDGDCEGQAANACFAIPGQGGFCTIEGCGSGDCAAPFVCCRDCNPAAAGALPFDESACVPQEVSSALAGQAGCTCD
jgi:pimeloyl-ACP methyl ester carboxylesterase